MMKRFFSIMLSLCIILALAAPVSAATADIWDEAGLLTAQEREKLEDRAREISNGHEIDVVILTVDSLDGKSSRRYAEDFYDGYRYGKDGILLLISMEDRDWCILANGNVDGILDDQRLGDALLDDLSAGDYYEAFDSYLGEIHDCLQDGFGSSRRSSSGVNILLSLVIGLAAAGISILVMRSGMNTARAQSGAAEYIKAGSYHLTQKQDMFLYSRVTKTRKAQNSSSSGSRGGSRRSSRSGKF